MSAMMEALEALRSVSLAGRPLPGRLLVGLSGGSDSVALFLLLLETEARVTAVHVNHNQRGAESDGDEAFVRELCSQHQVPLLVYRADLPSHASEEMCREARYAFFREAMTASGAEALMLAHHRDDQAESFLLHLLRGAGPAGLSGMQVDSEVNGIRVIRPLLQVPGGALRAYLTDRGQPWREDSSNRDEGYLRNAIRRELLPMMERLSPGASGRVASAAELIRNDHQYLQHSAGAFLREYSGKGWLLIAPLRETDPALQREILRQWWTGHRESSEEMNLTRQQTEELLRLVHSGSAGDGCPLPERKTARLGRQCLHLEPDPRPVDRQILPAADGAAVSGVTLRVSAKEISHGERLPAALLASCVIRTQLPGDYIIPFGKHTPVKINDYLAKRHVDAPFRRHVPLLCRGSEVLLACGAGTGSIPRQQEEPVWLCWEGSMPWKEETP